MVTFNPIQTGSGTPSPENIRPIEAPLNITGIGAVYGGYVDMGTGQLVVDRASVTIDGSQTLSDNGVMPYGGLQTVVTPNPQKAKAQGETSHGILCDRFTTDLLKFADPYFVTGRTANNNLYFNMPSGVNTIELATTWFTNNPTQVSYLLATPIVHQLTTAQLHEAIEQLNIPGYSILEYRRRVLMDQPHKETQTADIVSFKTTVPQTLPVDIAIEPVQDLHGQSSPYPAGGGANKAEFVDGYNIPANGVVEPYTSTSRCATLNPITIEDGKTYYVKYYGNAVLFIYSVFNGDTLIRRVANISSGSALDTSDGNKLYVCAYDGTVDGAKPLVAVNALPTSYSPYSNICPITGWTGANVSRTGKNLLPSIMTQSGTNVVVLGQNDPYGFGLTLKAGTYTVSLETDSLGAFYYREKDGTENKHIGGYNTTSATFTLAKDVTIRLWFYKYDGVSTSDLSKPQLELGSTASDYEEYKGETYSVDWETEAGTVYGGTLDVTTGELVVDRIGATYAISEMTKVADLTNVTRYGKSDFFQNNVVGNASGKGKTLCNVIGQYAYNTSDTVHYYVTTNGGATICVPIGTDTSTQVQIVATLATPIVYQLTPAEISALKGINNLWNDISETAITYWTRKG